MGTGEFRRRYERRAYSSDVIFSLRDKAYAGALKDISMGGAFVITLAAGQVSAGDIGVEPLKEKEMVKIAEFIDTVLRNSTNEEVIQKVKEDIKEFTKDYPIPGIKF